MKQNSMNSMLKCQYLSNHSLSVNLSNDQLLDVVARAKFRIADRGEHIYFDAHSDKRIYMVLKGVIKISEMSDSGNEIIKEICREGDFFGDLAFGPEEINADFAIALVDDSIICSFHIEEFESILNRYAVLALNFAKKVSGKIRKLETRHANLVSKDVKTRLIHFIKDWAFSEGKRKGNTIVLTNYLTHNDIAGLISTSRQSVTILLNELKDSGAFSYNRREIEINTDRFYIN